MSIKEIILFALSIAYWNIYCYAQDTTKLISLSCNVNNAYIVTSNLVQNISIKTDWDNSCSNNFYRNDKPGPFVTPYDNSEVRSGWIKFIVDESGTLEFSVAPHSEKDGYSFCLYNFNACRKGFSVADPEGWRKNPLRAAYIQYPRENNSPIGLKSGGNGKVNFCGNVKNAKYLFCEPLDVVAGDTLLLGVITYWRKDKMRYPEPFDLSINLPIRPFNKTITLKDISFVINKSTLLPASFPELDKLVLLLKQNPNMQIALVGHTDNSGNEKDNKLLSENRAKAVYDYLINKGIDKSRLQFKGYGSKQPLVPNVNEENKAKNRRVEMVIIKE